MMYQKICKVFVFIYKHIKTGPSDNSYACFHMESMLFVVNYIIREIIVIYNARYKFLSHARVVMLAEDLTCLALSVWEIVFTNFRKTNKILWQLSPVPTKYISTITVCCNTKNFMKMWPFWLHLATVVVVSYWDF